MKIDVLERASRIALNLIFPPQCALCRRGGQMLCDACVSDLPAALGRRCARCWMPVHRGDVCAHCRDAPPAFAIVRAAYVMEDGARRLAHELKYNGMTALAEPMATLIATNCQSALHGVDLIVPVPLHARRERSRGYNQAAALAKYLAAVAGVGFDGRATWRIRDTAPLVKTMRGDERRAIVRDAFVALPERVEGRRVLLIDDVVTTGATLDACSGALLAAGAAGVRCATWARAD